ncbi:amino acid adenylation domain-containing protein [Natroniella sp. ANB-PHB2]|uniref:non-ribosomal peptide synthetase n=1 Tax=Natroniella sp. ANB-PHB2 TaxID=3384444 RepID=UPI0038D47A1E
MKGDRVVGRVREEDYQLNKVKEGVSQRNNYKGYNRLFMTNFWTEKLNFNFNENIVIKLKSLAKSSNVTLSEVLVTAFNVLLYRYTGQESIVIGVPDIINSDDKEYKLLPVRSFPNSSKSFKAFLDELKEEKLQISTRKKNQSKDIFSKSTVEDDDTFDLFFCLDNEVENVVDNMDNIKFILTGIVTDKKIELDIGYRNTLFRQDGVKRLINHFKNIIVEVTKNPKIKLSEINMLSSKEKDKLLYEFNDTAMEYPTDKTIFELFERQVEKTPDNIAVVFEDEELTYQELNQKSNQLANLLRKKGVEPNDVVGIMLEPSMEMVVGVLAILKAGAAYLPIDANYPMERINYMVEDSNLDILLGQKESIVELDHEIETINLEDEALYQGTKSDLKAVNQVDDLAYIIYTSGSTGKPKGVMVGHRSLVNLATWHNHKYKVTTADRASKYAGFGFDASVWEIFPYLIKGASLYIIPDQIRLDSYKLNNYFKENKITISFLPTQLCEQFMKLDNNSLRLLLTGGDKLKYYQEQGYKLVNNYGPTENTVVSTSFVVDDDYDNIPIGKPINNCKAYVLDHNDNLQPIGVPGELCLAGDSLAKGYLNQPTKTAESFVDNPFVLGEKMYRTGDLVRWLPDGNLEFLGRIDDQVQIRGFRIELGEIENQLLNYEAIDEVVVIARKDNRDDKYLCGYFTAHKEVIVAELEEYLAKKLPDYMLPTFLIQLEEIPVNPNGKIDRKELPKPNQRIDTDYIAPKTELEKKLVEIYQEVLDLERVGIMDDFFALGGDSLKLMSLVNNIRQKLNVEIALKEALSRTTIKKLAEYINKIDNNVELMVGKVEQRNYYPLSSAQERVMIEYQLDQGSTNYNEPFVLAIEGEVEKDKFQQIFAQLIQRHEALRTGFEVVDGRYVQKIYQEVNFELVYMEQNKDNIEEVLNQLGTPFNLNRPPLIRAALIKVADRKYFLALVFHHIIIDGKSMEILLEEIRKLYKGEQLIDLKKRYRDYAVWQKEEFVNSQLENKQKNYWLKQFEGELPVLELPTDYTRPAQRSYEGDTITFLLPEKITSKVKRLAQKSNTTLYMVLFAAYNILLYRYTEQEDIIVGSPIAGRVDADLESVVGMFVNTLAMRNYPQGDKSFLEFLQEVKTNSIGAYENSDYQLDKIVDDLKLEKDKGRNPLFDTVFALQNINLKEVKIGDLQVANYNFKYDIAKFDLFLEGIEQKDGIQFNLQYSTRLFKRETMQRFVEHFKNILQEVVKEPKLKLAEIDILSLKERKKLLYEFNDTKTKYPRDKAIHELFEKQVEENPSNIAVVCDKKRLTYLELNQKANQLARLLRKKGVQSDVIVGIMVERTVEMAVGVMAILKAGGAYLPIDPKYPAERVKYMVEDSKPNLLLAQEKFIDQIELDLEVINLNNESLYCGDNTNLIQVSRPEDLAYIMYTSGSTGRPKGVMVQHRNVIRLVKNTNYVEFSKGDRILQTGAIVFDATTFELWGALLNGLRLYLVDEMTILNAGSLGEALTEWKITTLWLTSPLFSQLADEDPTIFSGLKYLLVGGDVLNPQYINKVRKECQGIKIINGYGPTENTTFSTTYHIDREYENNIPIGKPISNSTAYIIDENNNLQPIGVVGELCVSGDGVSRGYLNKPNKTANAFIDNPFADGKIMYKTGDLARWLPDGNIEFLGRKDHQVKIRGFRIELGAIEKQLLKHEAIKESIVMVYKDKIKYLAAYIVAEEECSVAELKDFLADQLPDYMIPSYFIQLEEMPLNQNGKIDRKELPKPNKNVIKNVEYVAPKNEMERKLVDIWSEILNLKQIGTEENFFDLGGNSLAAMQLMNLIRLEYEIVIPIKEIYAQPTIKMLVEKIKEIRDGGLEEVSSAIKETAVSSEEIMIEEYDTTQFEELTINKSKIKNILLTGGTGFLGIHLLKELLIETKANIYCLIRKKSGLSPLVRLKKKARFYFGSQLDKYLQNRIVVVEGDLTKDNLGLKEKRYQQLSKKVDTVIHTAADVRHYGKYEDFKRINVMGTKRLLDFCFKNQTKKFHHTSTLSVIGSNGNKEVFKESDLNIGQNFIGNVYGMSKFEAEKLVYKARDKGLQASIYRIGLLVGRYKDGLFQENINENRFYNNLKGLITLGKVPTSYLNYKTDLSPIDRCSQAIVRFILCQEVIGYNFHLMNPNLISMEQLIDEMVKRGYLIEEVDDQFFSTYISKKIQGSRLNRELSIVFNDLGSGNHDFIKENTMEKISTKFTVDVLKGLGFSWPKIGEGFINRIIHHCEEVGYISREQIR